MLAGPGATASSETPSTTCEGGRVEVQRCVLAQCAKDAAKANRYEEAVALLDQSQRRGDEAAGALGLCKQQRRKAQRRVTWLTVGAAVGWAAAAGLGVWGAVQSGK